MSLFSTPSPADIYKEPRTGIEFPETLDGFKRVDIKSYEAETNKAGVLIQYSSKEAEITIYVRALGNEAHKTSADFLEETFAGIKAMEAKGPYSNVKFYAGNPDKERPGWKFGAFTSSSTNRFLISYIHCKVADGYLLKIRASTGNPKGESLMQTMIKIQEIMDKKKS